MTISKSDKRIASGKPGLEQIQSWHVRALRPGEVGAIDRFVAGHPAGLIYYSSAFRRFLEVLLDCDSRYMVAANEHGEIGGVLPLMVLRDSDGVAVANSLPFFGSHGGPLANDAAAGSALLCAYEKETAACDVAATTMIENPLAPLVEIPEHDFQDVRISQMTAIDCAPETLLHSFDASARRNIRKAEGSGITVGVENDAWDYLHSTHVNNMKAIGGMPKSPEFFRVLPETMGEAGAYNIYVARLNGVPIAALLLLYFGRVVEYFVPVIEHHARSLQPLALIVHRAMCEARERGIAKWNWGGTWPSQTGVYRFKKKFAAEERQYTYYTRVRDHTVLSAASSDLLARFPGFYVVPFGELRS